MLDDWTHDILVALLPDVIKAESPSVADVYGDLCYLGFHLDNTNGRLDALVEQTLAAKDALDRVLAHEAPPEPCIHTLINDADRLNDEIRARLLKDDTKTMPRGEFERRVEILTRLQAIQKKAAEILSSYGRRLKRSRRAKLWAGIVQMSLDGLVFFTRHLIVLEAIIAVLETSLGDL